MNTSDYYVYQALERCARFGNAHPPDANGGGCAATDFAALTPLISSIGHVDFQTGIPASGATVAKEQLFAELWEDLKMIANTARTIARSEPGFFTPFRLGDDAQRTILATAVDFLNHLQDPSVKAKFLTYDLPVNFVSDLQSDLAAITDESATQTDDAMSATGETARVRASIREGRELLKRLDTAVRNRFRHQPEILAEWRTASHIRRRNEPALPVTPPPITPPPVNPK